MLGTTNAYMICLERGLIDVIRVVFFDDIRVVSKSHDAGRIEMQSEGSDSTRLSLR